jgi:hypothetical protein
MAEYQKFYDASRKLPQVLPTEKEKGDIIYWGSDNLYPNYLASLMYMCAIHGGIIRSKVHYTVSGGLEYQGEDKMVWDAFFKNGNSDYNLDELSEPLSKDLEVYNAYAVAVTFLNGKPFQLDHVPFEKLRRRVDGGWSYSDDWSNRNEDVKNFKTLDLKNPVGRQLVVWYEKPAQVKLGKKLKSGKYPEPPYSGGIKSIETDIEITNFNSNEAANNFSIGTLISLNDGKPPGEGEAEALRQRVIDDMTGTDNANGVAVYFANGKDNAPTVMNLNGNNLADRYEMTERRVKENILLAHSVTSGILFGVKTAGQLGGTTELEVAYNLMKNGYFRYRQNALLSVINYLAKAAGCIGKARFKEVSLDFSQQSTPQAPQQLKLESHTDPILERFKAVGRTKDPNKIVGSRAANLDALDEERFIGSFQAFALTDLSAKVLNILKNGETVDGVVKALKIEPAKAAWVVKKLTEQGYYDKGVVTKAGNTLLAKTGAVKLVVMYSYEVRPELNQPAVIDTTRDFCREMMRENKVYTRQEIEDIGNAVERDVWRYRGGWYHNPDGDNTPFCRHYWQQNLVVE